MADSLKLDFNTIEPSPNQSTTSCQDGRIDRVVSRRGQFQPAAHSIVGPTSSQTYIGSLSRPWLQDWQVWGFIVLYAFNTLLSNPTTYRAVRDYVLPNTFHRTRIKEVQWDPKKTMVHLFHSRINSFKWDPKKLAWHTGGHNPPFMKYTANMGQILVQKVTKL